MDFIQILTLNNALLFREYEKKKAVNENIREVLLRVMNDYPQYGKIVQQIVDI